MSVVGANVARAMRNFVIPAFVSAMLVAGNVALADPPAPSSDASSSVTAPVAPDASASVEPALLTTPAPPTNLQPQATQEVVVPANTEVVLGAVEEISSKTAKLGDKVKLVTLIDVLVDGAVVIPKGTSGEGAVSYAKGKGSFGKSGKLEISFTSLDVNGTPLALTGKYQNQGKGNTGGTVAAVVGFGLIGGALVTGHSATIAPGEELRAQTAEAATLSAAFATAATAVEAEQASSPPTAESAVAAAPEAPTAN